MSTTLTAASAQWAKRPYDERFLSLPDLQAHVRSQKVLSTQKVVAANKVIAEPTSDTADAGLKLVGANGGSEVYPTHFAFGQLSSLAGAQARYLRTLPAALAADCVNWGLQSRDVTEVGLLVTRDESEGITRQLRAATGPNYGRVWNDDLVTALIEQVGDGRTGDFRVPGEFGKPVPVTKANTTLYAGDRDLFVFLADEEHRISVDNRRDGQPGSLARGFFVWNSEVGAGSIGAAFFLFDYACKNRIVWGAQQYKETRIRHSSGAPDRWLREIAPVLIQYANSSAAPVEATIAAAQAQKVENIETFLRSRKFKNIASTSSESASNGIFTAGEIAAIRQAHEREEGRPIETVWDVVTGVTAHAKTLDWQNERVAFERAGGRILDLVAA